MNKKKVIKLSLIVIILIAIAGFAYVLMQGTKIQKEMENIEKKYGSVEKETVDTVIEKFNEEMKNGKINTPAKDISIDKEEGLYWYVLTENISCYVRPVEFTEDYKKDNAELISIYFDKEGYKEDTAINYWKMLIKANNEELTDEEIDTFVENTKKDKDTSDDMTANGKGLYATIIETDNHYEYQVKRLYK